MCIPNSGKHVLNFKLCKIMHDKQFYKALETQKLSFEVRLTLEKDVYFEKTSTVRIHCCLLIDK